MTPRLRHAIEELWFAQGSAADAATAINKDRARVRWIAPSTVRSIWAKAKAENRLPPFHRPENGFDPMRGNLLKRLFWRAERAAA